MRHNETHFEQVPLDVVETALEQAALQSVMPAKTIALVLTPEDEAASEFLKHEESASSRTKP